jgi:serine/threonine protein kinase
LNTKTRRKRIAREVTLHAQLTHTSLLKALDSFEDSTRVCIVTELCPNGTLYRYLAGYPDGLPEMEVRGIMKDLVDGVKCIIPPCFPLYQPLLIISKILLLRSFVLP